MAFIIHERSYVVRESEFENTLILKGLAMIFAGQENPFIIFRSKEIIHMFQNK